MYIKCCDRCGRVTNNKVAFLLPEPDSKTGSYQLNGTWFHDRGIILCNNCLKEFERFRTEHDEFNKSCLVKEDNFDGKEQYKI